MTGAAAHSLPVQLRFGDTDTLGHINNAVYATYAELGRLAFFASLGIEAPGLILARLAIDFRRQVVLGDDCVITTRVVRVGTSSIELAQALIANGEVAADYEAVIVWFDYTTQRPVRVPDDARALLSPQPGRALHDRMTAGG